MIKGSLNRDFMPPQATGQGFPEKRWRKLPTDKKKLAITGNRAETADLNRYLVRSSALKMQPTGTESIYFKSHAER